MSQVVQTPEQQFYLAKLLGYDYEIQYKAGSSNIMANSLSRIDLSPLLNTSFFQPLTPSSWSN